MLYVFLYLHFTACQAWTSDNYTSNVNLQFYFEMFSKENACLHGYAQVH
jgi:hypothetical protein